MEDQDLFNRTRRTAATTDKDRLWDKGIIPYVFDSTFSESQQRLIKEAMREWEKSTCITFIERIPRFHTKFLKFTKSNRGCYFIFSQRFPNIKLISLQNQCVDFPTILHELGHAIGFEHEHNRPDRDEYVDIIGQNIHPDDVDEFMKLSHGEIETFNQTYDYRSVMHYPEDSFSFDWRLKTIIPKQENEHEAPAIGNKNVLSLGDIATTHLLYQCPKCGGTLLESSGSFRSPINASGLLIGSERCEWRIRAAKGEKIELHVTSLCIYESPDCTIDYLEIKNDNRTNSNILARRYCGDIYVAKIITSNYLVLTYVKTSDPSIYSSFRADYKTICGGDVEIEKDAPFNIESTNYPDAYPPNRRCIWYFTAPDKHRIVMRINYFALEMSDGCMNDFLEIRDGNDNHAVLIGLYCGIKDSWHVNSTDNKLSVVFGSNGMNQDNGFSATLTALPINS
ncbi:bone morphogenetic protein 1 homolog [Microplitis mediator]|uniref:bone morphogenetic protein 1 homolog n=1 Tax=Microplitis mediator TaxID=375433 RepID=UPI0025577F2F|nr:bone morphogenetic protein 1 homolog [Microplitis mediator]